ncbi:hypothetical protein H5V45_04125 [Nocardioides sp. KIGAM211]|uniref:Uncharacterized protein n=1 Tax=Nocardioides luti TaxID=2761101 RepID=A0A7X0V9P4_9ACTN|nr:hypothetical protein [Nocardioides luti]MBB6626505.1 hypothetical protein [Nocardioides luti]
MKRTTNIHRLTRGLVGLAVAATLVGLAAPAGAAVPETRVRPAQLDRGADQVGAHLEGKTVVDGDVRVPVRAGIVTLLGTSGDEYVVATSNANGSGRFHTFRLSADGDRTPLLDGVPIFDQVLSRDGSQVARSVDRTGESTVVRVWSAVDGERVVSRRFPGSATVLDFDQQRMVLGSWGPNRTVSWDVAAGTTRRVVNKVGYAADLRADRLAVLTGDPYNGGCSLTSRLSTPARTLWKSCTEVVRAFAPSGGRTATVHILSDGLGPREVRLHATGGRLLARYTAGYYFGRIAFETPRDLLLETYSRNQGSTVRCALTDCERAERLTPTPDYRVTPREQRALRP